jgi:hypothetical protein
MKLLILLGEELFSAVELMQLALSHVQQFLIVFKLLFLTLDESLAVVLLKLHHRNFLGELTELLDGFLRLLSLDVEMKSDFRPVT